MGAMAAVGTSGWSYGHWTDVLYPAKLEGRHQLELYAQCFPTVEINSTFYHLPRTTTTAKWRDLVPAAFRFAVKGSRLITHHKRLADCQDVLQVFLERLQPLRPKMSAILWQLPPSFVRDDAALQTFASLLPGDTRHALEIRHTSWLCEEVYGRLAERDIALVWVSASQFPEISHPTASWVYLRFHGLSRTYRHNYTEEELRPWADRVAAATAEGREALCYFNNDAEGHAVRNAATFARMLRERGVSLPDPQPPDMLEGSL